MNKFWDMAVVKDAVADTNIGQITLYGDISDTSWWGDEITPKQFKDDLESLGDISELEINLNSGGGDVFAGYTIYNILKRHKAHKTVYIDGLAASIASLIAMAGDEIIMPQNSMMMIHNAWTIAMGNATDLRDMAEQLDKVDGLLVDTYAQRTGLDRDEIADMMANETWLTGKEAVDKGFATQLEDGKQIAASIDRKYFDRYQRIPESVIPYSVDNSVFTISADGITVGTITANATSTYTVVSGTGTNLSNRGESEPVEEDIPQPVKEVEQAEIADAPDKIEEQRKDFNRIRRKIYERKN